MRKLIIIILIMLLYPLPSLAMNEFPVFTIFSPSENPIMAISPDHRYFYLYNPGVLYSVDTKKWVSNREKIEEAVIDIRFFKDSKEKAFILLDDYTYEDTQDTYCPHVVFTASENDLYKKLKFSQRKLLHTDPIWDFCILKQRLLDASCHIQLYPQKTLKAELSSKLTRTKKIKSDSQLPEIDNEVSKMTRLTKERKGSSDSLLPLLTNKEEIE